MIPLKDNIRSRHTPYVNITIIATCVGVFIVQFFSGNMLQEWAFVPDHLVTPAAWASLGVVPIILRIFTSMFMHGDFLHIIFNMLFLWVFGDNVEDRMGHGRYLVFYLLCGVIATLAHSVVTLFGDVPMVGASGAIAGVLGAYFVTFPRASVRALVPIFIIFTVVDLPAKLFIGIWFVFQIFSGLGSIGSSMGIAFWAHIGGFAAGYYLARYFVKKYRGRNNPPRPRVLDMRVT